MASDSCNTTGGTALTESVFQDVWLRVWPPLIKTTCVPSTRGRHTSKVSKCSLLEGGGGQAPPSDQANWSPGPATRWMPD